MPNEPDDEDEAMRQCAQMIVKEMIKPMRAMMALGAVPVLVIAQASDGSLALLPVDSMSKEKMGRLLRTSSDTFGDGSEIETLDLGSLVNAPCECPKCKAERAVSLARPLDLQPPIHP